MEEALAPRRRRSLAGLEVMCYLPCCCAWPTWPEEWTHSHATGMYLISKRQCLRSDSGTSGAWCSSSVGLLCSAVPRVSSGTG